MGSHADVTPTISRSHNALNSAGSERCGLNKGMASCSTGDTVVAETAARSLSAKA
jgi:hypothetical protein